MGHRAAHDGELRQAAAAAVVAMKGQQAAVVVLSRATEQAASAGLHRFHGDEVPDLQILNAIAATNDDATSTHGLRMTGFLTPVSGCGSRRVVIGPS